MLVLYFCILTHSLFLHISNSVGQFVSVHMNYVLNIHRRTLEERRLYVIFSRISLKFGITYYFGFCKKYSLYNQRRVYWICQIVVFKVYHIYFKNVADWLNNIKIERFINYNIWSLNYDMFNLRTSVLVLYIIRVYIFETNSKSCTLHSWC